MSNISVPKNSDQAPDIFPVPSFVNAEAPSSAKFNQLGQHIDTEFGVLSLATGNTFLHGLPNLGGALGNLKLLTAPVANSNSLIGVKPALFDGTNTLLNDMSAIVGTIGGDGLYPITITGGTLSAANIIQNPDLSYTIVNVAIATKDGNGNINEIFPGAFTPNSGYAGGPVSQFKASFGDLIIPGSNFYVLAVNTSVAGALAQTILNIGDLQYGRIGGYVDTNDNIQTLAGIPTMTAEMNAAENKGFAIRWHAKLVANGGIVSGANRVWTSTSGSTTFQAGSIPSPASVQSYISNMHGALVIPANATVGIYASVKGAPLTDSSANPIVPAVTYDGTTLSIAIPTANLANIIGATIIDVYFPALIPYRMLQSNNMNFGDEGNRLTDFVKQVIGQQYGWTQPTYPNTIANRLDADEASLQSLTSNLNSLAGTLVPNGSFDISTITPGVPDQWSKINPIGSATLGLDNVTSAHGQNALTINTGVFGGVGGGISLKMQSPMAISPYNQYHIKFKTFASTAAMTGSILVSFYDASKAHILGQDQSLWVPPGGVWPTAWSTRYGVIAPAGSTVKLNAGVLQVSIPATARYMDLTIIGGGGSAPQNATVEFDQFEFFIPVHSGRLYSTYAPGTYNFTTPSNCILVLAEGTSGGGSGGRGFGASDLGGSGAAGAYGKWYSQVYPDTTYVIQVGAGGAGVAQGSNGNDGGYTTFNGTQVTPGQGGHHGTVNNFTAGHGVFILGANSIAMLSNTGTNGSAMTGAVSVAGGTFPAFPTAGGYNIFPETATFMTLPGGGDGGNPANGTSGTNGSFAIYV